MTAAVPSAEAARVLVDGLVSAGIGHVCVTPGSRSTPLTVAFAGHPAVKAWLHLDERSSAFFALGLARALDAPVAVVCTSGTAAANFYPAVVEANLSRVPLIVCTADRPPRLREVGAEQTIAQAGMFGPNARWAHDLPVPTGARGEAAAFRAAAQRSAGVARGPLPGPVHLNIPYEEPLIDSVRLGKDEGPPTARAPRIRSAPPSPDVADVASELRERSRTLIVAGPETGGLPAEPVLALAESLGAPVVADPLSGLRTGAHDLSCVLDSVDALVRDPRARRDAPDAVIRFGGVPTSKPLNQYLAALDGAFQVVCDLPGSWRDPWMTADCVLPGDPGLTAGALADAIRASPADAAWRTAWLERDRRARCALRETALGFDELFEGRVFIELQEVLPAGSVIVAGNSMPVRDLDGFLARDPKPLNLVSNRGANGIDGVVSTALGAAAAADAPTFLVIGDLSFYHDLNGLWAARRHGLDLTVVLVNNHGGGIFHYLPQAAHEDVFEEWFGTPAGLDFAVAVEMYGGRHIKPGGWDEFRSVVALPDPTGLRVVEVRTDRERNAAMHRQAWAKAAEAAWGATGDS